MSVYYADEQTTLHLGDSLAVLRKLPDESVDCCVTSPPYFGLRDYGHDGQYGMEDSPADYVATMRDLFTEVRRVLTKDGTLWLNLGDSYYSGRGNPGPNADDDKQPARRGWVRPVDRPGQSWGRPKSLLGIPWRVAFALVDDGWTLRNDVIWSKPNAMPESVTDRLSARHEHVFLLSRSRSYWFDVDPIREPRSEATEARYRYAFKHDEYAKHGTGLRGGMVENANPLGRNPGDVWTLPTQPFAEAHFAVMPLTLAERCILAGCKPGGTVLDPFSGSGTTGLAAARHGRKYVGIDLSQNYLDLSLRTRLSQPGLNFEETA